MTTALEEVSAVPSGNARLILLDFSQRTVALGVKMPLPLRVRRPLSLAKKGLTVPSFIRVFQPVPIYRTPFFPSQCLHFNNRHPMSLGVQLVLYFSQLQFCIRFLAIYALQIWKFGMSFRALIEVFKSCIQHSSLEFKFLISYFHHFVQQH